MGLGSLGFSGWLDILPIIAAVFNMLAIFQPDEQKTRVLIFLNAGTYFSYYCALGATSMFAELLAAVTAVIGLIIPSLEYGGEGGLPVTVIGIFCGAVCLNLLDKVVPHLHHLFISEEIGAAKPSPLFFEACLAALAPLQPDEVLMIGDSLTADIAGAKACGIRTCWYRHGSHKDGSMADYCVADLREICGIL